MSSVSNYRYFFIVFPIMMKLKKNVDKIEKYKFFQNYLLCILLEV